MPQPPSTSADQPSEEHLSVDEPSLHEMPRVRPFLRWAGSKRLIVPQLRDLLPREFGTYYEPFLGAGSLYLALQPKEAHLGDALEPLMVTWESIKDAPEDVLDTLREWSFDKETYDWLKRQKFTTVASRAAQFLYLNRGAYGGLWRVNSAGEFNVPWSAPKTPSPTDEGNIRAVSKMLRSGVHLHCSGFAETVASARRGDLVFMDPPYSKGRPQRPFIHYNEKLFGWDQQVLLATEAERLRRLGVTVLVTNSTHPDIEQLYPNFRTQDLRRHSSLGSVPTRSMHLIERVFVSQ